MNISAFIIYCIVVTFTPGPTNIVILSSVQHHGARKTMVYVWGATLAFGLLLAASALLNQLLAGILPEILRIMQITGSVYMLYLAYQVYHMGRGSGADARYSTGFHSGLLMQFANPKVLLFTLTVIPGYVLPYHPSSAATLGFVSADILALSASMTDFTYKKHCHAEYAVGVTLRGIQQYTLDGSFQSSRKNGVMLFNPEQIHDGSGL